MEVLALYQGWGRTVFSLPPSEREIQVQLAAFKEVVVAISDVTGAPIGNAVFKFPGFHENAPMFPGGGSPQKFFSTDPDSPRNWFVLEAQVTSGTYKIKVVPGSSMDIEAPNQGHASIPVDSLLVDHRVVLQK